MEFLHDFVENLLVLAFLLDQFFDPGLEILDDLEFCFFVSLLAQVNILVDF